MSDNSNKITPGNSDLCLEYFSILSTISFGTYYTYSYTTIPKDLVDKPLSNWFMVYIILHWIELFTKYLNIKHIRNYWGIEMRKDLYEQLHPINRFPYSLLKFGNLFAFGLAIYFSTKFIPLTSGCDIYENGSDVCTSLRIISVISMIFVAITGIVLIILILLFLSIVLADPSEFCEICGICWIALFTGCCSSNQNSTDQTNSSQNGTAIHMAEFIGRQLNGYLPISSTPPSDGICAICMVDGSDQWKELSCEHKFHPHCIDSWFITQNNNGHESSCPLCRKIVTLV